MKKSLLPIVVVALALLVPSLAFAGANTFAVAKTGMQNGTVEMKVVIQNAQPLAAIDAPLRWSEGATLISVDFNGSDVEYADFKTAVIKAEERTVLMGVIFQLGYETRPELKAGENVLCKMVFRVDDPNLSEIKVEATETKNPNHSLLYVYHDADRMVRGLTPEFSGTAVSLTASELPTQFRVGQNYPNPFNPTTVVDFSVPNACQVKLTVYNVLGQTVKVPVNEYREAGEYSEIIDGSDMSSGVYFYKVQVGDQAETKKMLLVK